MVRKKTGFWMFWVLVLSIMDFVHPNIGASTPELKIPETVVTLNERAIKQEELMGEHITCTSPTGNPVRVFLSSVTPAVPCGNCFAVWPVEAVKGAYILYYNPGPGQLNYAAVKSYRLQVECTDGTSSSFGSVEVRLQPNSPPVFVVPMNIFETLPVFNTENKAVGTGIYTASANDPDKDAVFYKMETVPATDLFEIGRSDGIIRTTKDLRFLCRTNADFKISAFDAFNTPVGPRVVKAEFRFKDDPGTPIITNTQKVIEMREDPDHKPPGTDTVVLLPETSPLKAGKYNWKMTAVPERGLEYYVLETKNDNIKVRAKRRLDYEYEPLRSVTLYLTANNGYCESEPYSVRIDLVDVNEKPYFFPYGTSEDPKNVEVERTVYEGVIQFHPNVTVRDPDLDENLKWELKSDTDAFYVDQSTGTIYSAGEFDVDKNTEFKVRTLVLEVQDKRKEKVRLTVKLTILDKNDNPPQFSQRLVNTQATECSPVGKDLAKLGSIDFDSKFQGNSKMTYSGRGQNLTVTATGHVILTTQCTAGDKETFTAHVEDQGTYPGPLKGVPTTVTFTCKECPPTTTVAPVTDPAAGGGAGGGGGTGTGGGTGGGGTGTGGIGGTGGGGTGGTGTGGIGTGGAGHDEDARSNLKEFCKKDRNKGNRLCRVYTLDNMNNPNRRSPNAMDFLESNAGWIIPASLATAVFLALLAYMLWQHCWKGLAAAKPSVQRAPKPKKVKVKTKPVKQKPQPEQPPPPPPPPVLQPYNEPRLFGFWKETFPDRDQRQMPKRDAVPMNVAEDSKIDKKNKVEEQKERQEWREERQKQVQQYQKQLQSYTDKHGGRAPDAHAFWYSGTTGTMVRGGTGEQITANRQWDSKPAGGEDGAAPGQSRQAASRAVKPGPASQAAAFDPAVHAWYTE